MQNISEPHSKVGELVNALTSFDGLNIRFGSEPNQIVSLHIYSDYNTSINAYRQAQGDPLCIPEHLGFHSAQNQMLYSAIDMEYLPSLSACVSVIDNPVLRDFTAAEGTRSTDSNRDFAARCAALARLEILSDAMHGYGDLPEIIRKKSQGAEIVQLDNSMDDSIQAQANIQLQEYQRLQRLSPERLAEELNRTAIVIASHNVNEITRITRLAEERSTHGGMQVVMPQVPLLFEVIDDEVRVSTKLHHKLMYDSAKSISTGKVEGLLARSTHELSEQMGSQLVKDKAKQRIAMANEHFLGEIPLLLAPQYCEHIANLPAAEREVRCLQEMFAILASEQTESDYTSYGGYIVDAAGFVLNTTGSITLPVVGTIGSWAIESAIEKGIVIYRQYRHLKKVDSFLWHLTQLRNARLEQGKPDLKLPVSRDVFEQLQLDAEEGRARDVSEKIAFAVRDILTVKTLVREFSDTFPIWGIVHNPITTGEKKDNRPRLIALEKILRRFIEANRDGN